ncbi:hypothetical protein [Schinkia azotoformans]|nr:hypothetical protein [Schinkia azotoformans]MEC1789656.1 hypothetical protein [Schinkia azotoformans]
MKPIFQSFMQINGLYVWNHDKNEEFIENNGTNVRQNEYNIAV